MNKFKYLKISKNKQIRYLINNYQEKTYIVFLHGFMSDIEGKKPKTIFKYARKQCRGFLYNCYVYILFAYYLKF